MVLLPFQYFMKVVPRDVFPMFIRAILFAMAPELITSFMFQKIHQRSISLTRQLMEFFGWHKIRRMLSSHILIRTSISRQEKENTLSVMVLYYPGETVLT